jgi:hypothetical protein
MKTSYKKPRICQACGSDCAGIKVGSKYFSKVICQSCHFSGYSGFDKKGKVVLHPEKDWRK